MRSCCSPTSRPFTSRWGTPDRIPIRRLTVEAAAAGVATGVFAAGSMGPKVTAAADFVHRTHGFAAIGALEEAAAVLAERSGTRLVEASHVPAQPEPAPRRPASRAPQAPDRR